MAKTNLDKIKYCCNPAVGIREEDENGGLLYDPSKKKFKLVNLTGLFIWKQFITPSYPGVAINAVYKQFEEVPMHEVERDVLGFIDQLLEIGFLDVVG